VRSPPISRALMAPDKLIEASPYNSMDFNGFRLQPRFFIDYNLDDRY